MYAVCGVDCLTRKSGYRILTFGSLRVVARGGMILLTCASGYVAEKLRTRRQRLACFRPPFFSFLHFNLAYIPFAFFLFCFLSTCPLQCLLQPLAPLPLFPKLSV
ncbi:hypothetical protein B0H34DRAFT_701042 [Crassisporium funariophilum]|nr:hypothetical protein B0H34DRAFT_701042 [Crassisporium funariophilum]